MNYEQAHGRVCHLSQKSVTLLTANYPILYSFRRCPYAIRARLAIAASAIKVELREIELRNKPEQLLTISTKGTVPVLHLADNTVIDESLEIMFWALAQNDPFNWLEPIRLSSCSELIEYNDGKFKYFLDRYKYADRYPDHTILYYRERAEQFLGMLEKQLRQTQYLCSNQFSFADAAILPFVRQFAAVDPHWFQNSPYKAVHQWLQIFLNSELFESVMIRYQPWAINNRTILFFP